MLKGMSVLQAVLGTLIVVSFVAFSITYGASHAAFTTANMLVEKKAIQVVDMAHLVKKCVSEDGYVLEDYLTDSQIDSCNFPWVVFISVKDLETEETWFLKRGDGEERHRIYVSLKRNSGEIHMGELVVQV